MSDDTSPSVPPSGPTTRDLTQTPAGELPEAWSLLGGQYIIQRLIASGGFGITYLAKDTLGRDVAVKECFPLGLAQRDNNTRAVSATSAGTSEHFETARAQFLREARMLAQLQHPNVVHVQTLFEENGTAYMAMDFIHGRDLHEEIIATEGSLPPSRVLELARDLLGALDYIHGQGVLHRDIKPQNIRIDRFGVPMLIDFGAARAETQARSRMAGTFRVVTDGYSPHEFYVTGAAQGPHSDLYALAASLHHVITGAAPVAADERASAIATGQPDPYQPIAEAYPAQDSRLLHLIDRALRMTPAERPENAAAWLTALADAPTTLVTPVAATPAEPQRSSRFLPGLALGALLAGGGAAGIWAAQPDWIYRAMPQMMERMGLLEANLAEAEAARGAAEAELGTLQTTLTEAEETLARLEAADGDMAATVAELDAARAARDAAAARITELEEDLAALAATQAALESAQAERDAAEAQAAQLRADGVEAAEQIAALEMARDTAQARIEELEGELAITARNLNTARAQADLLVEVQSDLTQAEAALYAATTRAAALERQLQQALDGEVDVDTLRGELEDLQAALTQMEQERDALMAQIAAASASTDANVGEMERLRARVAELEAENEDLRAALARAEAALGQSGPATDGLPWQEGPELRAPNGSITLLPRFSWQGDLMTLVDDTGGVSLFNRVTGGYEGHLARGIPDDIARTGFSLNSEFLIVTTEGDALDRLYHVASRREILRFSPTTITTASRAINRDGTYFLHTREGPDGQINVVVHDIGSAAAGAAIDIAGTERIITSAPAGSFIRVSFTETADEIVVLTDQSFRVFTPNGQLLTSGQNNLGRIAAISPMGRDMGFLVLRPNGDVAVYDNPGSTTARHLIPARTSYTYYRLSGDRLSFLRSNRDVWEVIDLQTGQLRGSGPIEQGYEDATVAVSADGSMLFIGATEGHPGRVLNVATGELLQEFEGAEEGYFSFDDAHFVSGTLGETTAQIWDFSHGREVNIGASPAPTYPADTGFCSALGLTSELQNLTPDFRGANRLFPGHAGGAMNLRECWSVLPDPLATQLSQDNAPIFVTPDPVLSLNMLATSRRINLTLRARGSCTSAIVAQFGDEWHVAEFDEQAGVMHLTDPGDISQPLRVWLASGNGDIDCAALIDLGLAE